MNNKEPFILLRHERTDVYAIAGEWRNIPALRVALDLGVHTKVELEYNRTTNVTILTEYINDKNITPLMSTSES